MLIIDKDLLKDILFENFKNLLNKISNDVVLNVSMDSGYMSCYCSQLLQKDHINSVLSPLNDIKTEKIITSKEIIERLNDNISRLIYLPKEYEYLTGQTYRWKKPPIKYTKKEKIVEGYECNPSYDNTLLKTKRKEIKIQIPLEQIANFLLSFPYSRPREQLEENLQHIHFASYKELDIRFFKDGLEHLLDEKSETTNDTSKPSKRLKV